MFSHDQINTGDILICKGKSSLSKLISKSTGSDITHTAQAIRINGILYIIDAQKEGVLPRKFNAWNNEFNYEFEVFRSVKKLDPKKFIDNSMQYCGINYDFKGLGIGLLKSFFRAKNMNENFRNDGKFWCSEYTMKLIGVENPEDYSPKLVREYLVKEEYILIGTNYGN